MKDQETKEKFIELRAKGLSFDRIAKKLKISKQTLINWSKEYKHEIDNLRRIELEALQEQYYMLKRQRIELFGEKLKALRAELDKRDFSDLPTDKIFDLFAKCFHLLSREAVDTVFIGKEDFVPFDLSRQISWQG